MSTKKPGNKYCLPLNTVKISKIFQKFHIWGPVAIMILNIIRFLLFLIFLNENRHQKRFENFFLTTLWILKHSRDS